MADDTIFKPFNEYSRSDGQRIILGRSSLELFPVHLPYEIDVHCISRLYSPVCDLCGSRFRFQRGLDRRLHIILCDLTWFFHLSHLYALVLCDLYRIGLQTFAGRAAAKHQGRCQDSCQNYCSSLHLLHLVQLYFPDISAPSSLPISR